MALSLQTAPYRLEASWEAGTWPCWKEELPNSALTNSWQGSALPERLL